MDKCCESEIENFILWFWSDDNDRKRPLMALKEYLREEAKEC